MNKQWKELSHNGPAFPDSYESKGVAIKVNDKEITLNNLAEEMIYSWAKKKDTDYVNDPVFRANFLKSLRPNLPKEIKSISIEQIDFTQAYNVIEQERSYKESLSKEEKKRITAERKVNRENLKERYGYAKVDGNECEIANWMIEPPGLFMGRGEHPLRGTWKPVIKEKDVTLNLGKNEKAPKGEWGKVVHDDSAIWFASWRDYISKKIKYVYPSESSGIKQERDKIKYDEALKLEKRIKIIRNKINKMLTSKNTQERKIATVCYLLDELSMRVGDEKDEDEADTVGAITLRIEHVKIKDNKIEFDFLGKDSVRWNKTIKDVNKSVLNNFKEFTKDKESKEEIFDNVTSNKVNRFLDKVSPGLTTKVFRTYHATNLMKNKLNKIKEEIVNGPEYSKIHHFKMANLEVAIRCNHKRSPPKSCKESINKKEERLTKMIEAPPKKTEKSQQRHLERIEKNRKQIQLAKATKEYSVNTSLKNYIDPRVVKKWAKKSKIDWKILYSKSLQKKFGWTR